MALTTHSTVHFPSGRTLDVVETIAQICAATPPLWPGTLTLASGLKVYVNLPGIEWIEPK